jgi:hypothetical protein
MLKGVEIVDAEYETGASECVLAVEKDAKCPVCSAEYKLVDMFDRSPNIPEESHIYHVSIEADCRRTEPDQDGRVCKGLFFTGLAALTKKFLPGVPLTTIQRVESIVSQFANNEKDGREKMDEPNKPNTEGDVVVDVSVDEAMKTAATAQNQVSSVPPIPAVSQQPSLEVTEPAVSEIWLEDLDLPKEAQWSTAYVNDLPDDCFAYIEPGGTKDEQGKTVPRSLRHLPYKDKDGKPDAAHVRNALARLSQTDISADAKAKAKKKLIAAAKELGIDVTDELLKLMTNEELIAIAKQSMISGEPKILDLYDRILNLKEGPPVTSPDSTVRTDVPKVPEIIPSYPVADPKAAHADVPSTPGYTPSPPGEINHVQTQEPNVVPTKGVSLGPGEMAPMTVSTDDILDRARKIVEELKNQPNAAQLAFLKIAQEILGPQV